MVVKAEPFQVRLQDRRELSGAVLRRDSITARFELRHVRGEVSLIVVPRNTAGKLCGKVRICLEQTSWASRRHMMNGR